MNSCIQPPNERKQTARIHTHTPYALFLSLNAQQKSKNVYVKSIIITFSLHFMCYAPYSWVHFPSTVSFFFPVRFAGIVAVVVVAFFIRCWGSFSPPFFFIWLSLSIYHTVCFPYVFVFEMCFFFSLCCFQIVDTNHSISLFYWQYIQQAHSWRFRSVLKRVWVWMQPRPRI